MQRKELEGLDKIKCYWKFDNILNWVYFYLNNIWEVEHEIKIINSIFVYKCSNKNWTLSMSFQWEVNKIINIRIRS